MRDLSHLSLNGFYLVAEVGLTEKCATSLLESYKKVTGKYTGASTNIVLIAIGFVVHEIVNELYGKKPVEFIHFQNKKKRLNFISLYKLDKEAKKQFEAEGRID